MEDGKKTGQRKHTGQYLGAYFENILDEKLAQNAFYLSFQAFHRREDSQQLLCVHRAILDDLKGKQDQEERVRTLHLFVGPQQEPLLLGPKAICLSFGQGGRVGLLKGRQADQCR